jgi:hypothetical protein
MNRDCECVRLVFNSNFMFDIWMLEQEKLLSESGPRNVRLHGKWILFYTLFYSLVSKLLGVQYLMAPSARLYRCLMNRCVHL